MALAILVARCLVCLSFQPPDKNCPLFVTCMYIPYHTTNFKSANTVAIVIFGSTATIVISSDSSGYAV